MYILKYLNVIFGSIADGEDSVPASQWSTVHRIVTKQTIEEYSNLNKQTKPTNTRFNFIKRLHKS